MTRKHIALIYTGGTVGMMKTADGYAPMQDFGAALAARLANCEGCAATLHLARYRDTDRQHQCDAA